MEQSELTNVAATSSMHIFKFKLIFINISNLRHADDPTLQQKVKRN